MREISFYPGYYEWVLDVDNEFYYSFGDITDTVYGYTESDDNLTENEWEYWIDILINNMRKILEEEEYKKEPLSKEELEELRQQMLDGLIQAYGFKDN